MTTSSSPSSFDDDAAVLPVTIRSLHLYPVKSCAGAELDSTLLVETGFELDRAWMLVDARGEFLSQRELPRLALVRPQVKHYEVILRAPGMLPLHLPTEAAERPLRVRVWDDACDAWDMGDAAAQWFADFLGAPLRSLAPDGVRLARFDPDFVRACERRWTGALDARTAFADGFPLLVLSQASLDAFNARRAARGEPAVTMARFRPNLVLDGLDAHAEDHVDTIEFESGDARVLLKLVKPCARCTIPNVDPDTGAPGERVLELLSDYRADARVDGGITFGMNAVVVDGIDRVLCRGMQGRARLAL
jgi:uncharacterized protein YcbX